MRLERLLTSGLAGPVSEATAMFYQVPHAIACMPLQKLVHLCDVQSFGSGMCLHVAVHASKFVWPTALIKGASGCAWGSPASASTRACAQDYQHIEQGYYSLPWDMVETRNRQWSPLHVARRSAQVIPVLA